MESLGTAVLELVADTKPLVAGLEKGKAASEEMASTTASGFRSGITKAAIPAALAIGAVAVGLHKSLDAAEANQVAEAKLAAAFKASGINIDDYKGKIDAAEQSSAGLGFKSEDVKASLAQLVVATHSGSGAIRMLATAQDVARYKGISLTDASKLLTTTMAGSSRAAHALGITMAPVTTATDALKAKTQYATLAEYEHAKSTAYLTDKQATAKEMIGLLTDKLGGQAQAFSKTAEGAKEKMGAEFQLLEINIGNVLIPVLTMLSTWLASVSEEMTKHAAIVKVVLVVVIALSAAVLAVNAGLRLYEAYTKLAAVAQWLFNAALDANPIGLVVIAIAALVAAFIIAWDHSKTFRSIVLGVWADVKDATMAFVNFFTTSVPNAVTTVKNAITDGLKSAKNWVREHWPEIATVISGPFAPIVALATGAFGIRARLEGAINGIIGWIRGMAGTVESAAASFGQAIYNGIIGGMAGLGAALYNAILGPLKSILGKLKGALSHIPGAGGLAGAVGSALSVVGLASGGIVTRPTLAVIGEAGPEAVVPLSHPSIGGGGGGGTNIVVNVSGVVGNERDVAIKIGRELEKLTSRGMGFGIS